MFSLLADRFVQEAPTVNELFFLRMTCAIASIATIEPGIHPAVARVVDRALAFAQADRWPDARAMQAAVREAHAAIGGVAPWPASDPGGAEPRSSAGTAGAPSRPRPRPSRSTLPPRPTLVSIPPAMMPTLPR
jgi:serine/threonine-protein kinase